MQRCEILQRAMKNEGRALAAGFVRLGRWQTGLSSRPAAGVLGVVWALLLAWSR